MSSRRTNLRSAVPPQSNSHAGLWFDKYLKEQIQDGGTLEPYEKHIEQVSDINGPAAYTSFFERWKGTLQKIGAQMQEAGAVARLAAGLGGASVIENGMTLHHTYGVPFIPGSSLKGIARAYATANLEGPWAMGGSAFRTLFGGQIISPGEKPEHKARVGIAVFLDALPVPATWKIHNEVMTVHHKTYYQSGEQPPADWDSPTPIPFPSVSGRFLIAVHAVPDAKEWAVSAMGILKMALAEIGVGGKTSSGFGRLDITEPEPSQSEQFGIDFLQQLNELPNNQVAQRINSFYNRWRTDEIPPNAKQQIAQAILDKVEAANRTKASQEKGWFKALVDCVKNNNCPE